MNRAETEIEAAVQALVHRLRNRAEPDDEPFAREFITALRRRGWRHTQAGPAQPWQAGSSQAAGHRSDPPRELLRELRSHLGKLNQAKPSGRASLCTNASTLLRK